MVLTWWAASNRPLGPAGQRGATVESADLGSSSAAPNGGYRGTGARREMARRQTAGVPGLLSQRRLVAAVVGLVEFGHGQARPGRQGGGPK